MSRPIRTVAISRQRGSGGSFVGRTLADRLGYRYIDRELLRDACEYLCARDAQQQEAANTSWWSRIGQTFALGVPDCGYVPPSTETVYEGELFDIQMRLIQEIVDEHQAVIVGRGAAQTLHGRSGVVSVLLRAPESFRIDRVQEIYHLDDRREAQRLVYESDRDRARFIRAIAGIDWTDVAGYDLVIDTAAVGFGTAVEMILRAAHVPATRV